MRNPAHERRAAEIIRAEFPDVSVSISSDVVRGDARVRALRHHLRKCLRAALDAPLPGQIEEALRAHGFRGPLRLMQSAGGLVSPEMARDFPIRLLESGPAGGGLATALFAEAAGLTDVISFDMGGTTAKACLIEDGRAEVAPMMEAARVHRFSRARACRSRRRWWT